MFYENKITDSVTIVSYKGELVKNNRTHLKWRLILRTSFKDICCIL